MNEIKLTEIDDYIIDACGSSSEVERITQGKDKIYFFYQWLDKEFQNITYKKVKGTQRVMEICINDQRYLCCLSYRDMSAENQNSYTIAEQSVSGVWDTKQDYKDESWWIILLKIESGKIVSAEICSRKVINEYEQDKEDKIITRVVRKKESPYYSCNYSKLNGNMKQDFKEWLKERGAFYV